MAIPVTAEIRGFAGIHVPAKFHVFAGILYRDYTLNLVIFLRTINNETTQITNQNRSKKLLYLTNPLQIQNQYKCVPNNMTIY